MQKCNIQQTKTMESRNSRSGCNANRGDDIQKYRIQTGEVKEQISIGGSIVNKHRVETIMWYWHIQRMSQRRLPRQAMKWKLTKETKITKPKTI